MKFAKDGVERRGSGLRRGEVTCRGGVRYPSVAIAQSGVCWVKPSETKRVKQQREAIAGLT